MSNDHVLARGLAVVLIAAGATFVSAKVDGFPPLLDIATVRAEPVCTHATGQDLDRVVSFCFDPRTLLASLEAPLR